ncbi:PAS domain-containing protein [Methylobacterium durans]|uniref:PAS domain-containing protein n=1 Tax=Methylobacterium durans TaxID=2202825 RepID=UPI002B000CAA|nr:PAS domain-containing protein [Methylobacterium durans]MEA1830795.1 PAS domain-containing protein [Methylobacterium durans]
MAARIRAHDWAATPLGPSSAWPSRLKLMVEQVLASPLVASLVCRPGHILLYNDTAARLYGVHHPGALGRSLPETWPDGYAAVAHHYERVFGGESVHVPAQPLAVGGPGQVFDAYLSPVRDDGGRVFAVQMIGFEISGRLRAEAALRESEERQVFLLRLSDTLRPLDDAVEVQDAAARILGEHLGADRTYYAVVVGDYEFAIIERDYVLGDAPSVVGQHAFSSFGSTFEAYRTGRVLVLDDVEAPGAVPISDLPAFRALSIRSLVSMPLFKNGRTVASMTVLKGVPHRWTAREISLVEDVAERTWAAVERARAEAAQRESEERFQQFAASSSDALWIRDGTTLAMEYVSPAIRTIYGVPPDAILGDPKRWAALIVPEDRDVALAHLERARGGEAVTHEFRILRPSDGAFRWIRNTDFPLLDAGGAVQRIAGIAEDVTDSKQAAEHQTVLLLELQHRVRNILAMIRSIAERSGETAGSVDDYRDRLVGRLRALARTQTLLTRAVNAGVDLESLIRVEVEAQAAHEGQFSLGGPKLLLSPKAAEVVTLAVHELATNACKYGAFTHSAGRLSVTWRIAREAAEQRLHLDWIETGAIEPLTPPQRRGFGTTLIEQRIPYELQGSGKLGFEPQGLQCRLEFPLRRGDSILETGMGTLRATIAGGSLDMAGEVDLSGCKVLVVEDDYFIATDTERALRRAGGSVVGPVGRPEEALALIAQDAPHCAVVDINLGEGARFEVAETLQERGVPFIFVTGYDDVMIPPRFQDVERLRKPVEFREVVRAAAQMCAT